MHCYRQKPNGVGPVHAKKHSERPRNKLPLQKLLTHYDPTLPIKLAADASAYGVGAVISDKMLDVTVSPITFASRTLTKNE